MSRLTTSARAFLLGTGLLGAPVLSPALGVALAEQPELLVRNKGEKPRRELRFAPPVGSTEQVRMEMLMSTEMAMGAMAMPSMALPAMYLDMDIEVLEIEADGDIKYTFTIAGTSVGEDPDGMPGVGQAMQEAMAPMIGTKGTVVVSPTGVTRETELVPAAGADPKMVDDMQKGMANTSAPMPQEAVGVGATWDLVQTLENQGLVVKQTASYEIVELTAESVTLSVTLTQDAGSQTFSPEGMPPGSSATLNSMSTAGTGTSLLRFDQVMPQKAEVNLQTNMDLVISANGQEMPMTNKLDMTTVIGPR